MQHLPGIIGGLLFYCFLLGGPILFTRSCHDDAVKSIDRDRVRLNVLMEKYISSGKTCYDCQIDAVDKFEQSRQLVIEYVCK